MLLHDRVCGKITNLQFATQTFVVFTFLSICQVTILSGFEASEVDVLLPLAPWLGVFEQEDAFNT